MLVIALLLLAVPSALVAMNTGADFDPTSRGFLYSLWVETLKLPRFWEFKGGSLSWVVHGVLTIAVVLGKGGGYSRVVAFVVAILTWGVGFTRMAVSAGYEGKYGWMLFFFALGIAGIDVVAKRLQAGQ